MLVGIVHWWPTPAGVGRVSTWSLTYYYFFLKYKITRAGPIQWCK
jgi:hypothetical protein